MRWRTGHSEPTSKGLAEEPFKRMLSLERKRSERSKRRFVLMLLSPGTSGQEGVATKLLQALTDSTRDTDITGWYDACSVIGVIFTEIGCIDAMAVESILLGKIAPVLHSTLSAKDLNEVKLLFRVYPEACTAETAADPTFIRYTDLIQNTPVESGRRDVHPQPTNEDSAEDATLDHLTARSCAAVEGGV